MENNMRFRPMLAPLNSPKDTPSFFQDIQFPQLVSPKVDGIRAVVREVTEQDFTTLTEEGPTSGLIATPTVLSRNLEKFRSAQVAQRFGDMLHCDGELAYDPTAPDCLHVTQSHVSSFNKPCETLKYYVFDWCEDAMCMEPYYLRLEKLTGFVEMRQNPFVEVLPQLHVDTLDELLAAEEEYLAQGFEGIMFRSPVGHYKHNRATYRENLIYKLKRFTDSEAYIVDIVEGETNTNARETDARGFSKRSSAKVGMVPNGMVKHFVCKDIKTGEDVNVMPGVLKHAQRKYILENNEEFIGKILTYRYFGYGVKDRVRFSRFIAFREKWDM